MKSLFFFLLISIFSFSHAQSEKDENIKFIRKQVETINTEKNYKVVEKEAENTVLNGYLKNKELKKLIAYADVANGIYSTEYYYYNNKPIFVFIYQKTFEYDEKKGTINTSKINYIYETRIYIKDDKVIEIKYKGGNEDESDYSYEIENAYDFAKQFKL